MFRSFLCALSIFSAPISAFAHEFWIEPIRWQIEIDTLVEAHIRVGEDLKGAPLAYIPSQTRRFDIVTPTGVFNAGRTIGDRPALRGKVVDDGLHIVIYVTTSGNIVYNDAAKFEKFVNHKDLGNTLAEHVERGLPEAGFSEDFSRYAKSLISVGEGRGSDRFFGLLTEITALANPYTDDVSAGMPIYVSYRGKPRADEQVEIFERDPEGVVAIRTTRTDAQGKAMIDVKPGHDYMLDSVVMRPMEPKDDDDPVWESLWANLTFHVPTR